MTYSADFLIERRKAKWKELKSIDYDKKLRRAIAGQIITSEQLLAEIKKNPEKLIELEFVVVDKEQRTTPFFFNEVQRDFIERLNAAIKDFEEGLIQDISILILKGRQQGFTTLVTAYQLATSILNRNFQGFTLADVADNSEAIFQNKAKFPYMQLPDILKPTEKFNNRRQLLFEKINSSWEVDTATKDVGRSRTISFFHGSECAFWQQGIAPIQAGLGQAFTKNCIKVYESTANGYIKIYQIPNSPEITKYCIGGDTAGEGSDWFTGHVLNAKTGEQAAVLKHQFDADQYVKQMYCLGVYYKNALIAIEANFDSYPIMELQRIGYGNQYVREAQDTYTGKLEKRFGFRTTVLTRPTIISRLVEIVRENTESLNDEDTIRELLTIVRNEKGKVEAPEGRHDDQMMGLAIAHQAREQVVFDTEEIHVKHQYHFNIESERERTYDFGEDITIV